jgi:hypothetical protein
MLARDALLSPTLLRRRRGFPNYTMFDAGRSDQVAESRNRRVLRRRTGRSFLREQLIDGFLRHRSASLTTFEAKMCDAVRSPLTKFVTTV